MSCCHGQTSCQRRCCTGGSAAGNGGLSTLPFFPDLPAWSGGALGGEVTPLAMLAGRTLPPEDQRRMSLAAEAYVRAMLERDFRTLDFYKSLRGAIPVAEPVKNENQQ